MYVIVPVVGIPFPKDGPIVIEVLRMRVPGLRGPSSSRARADIAFLPMDSKTDLLERTESVRARANMDRERNAGRERLRSGHVPDVVGVIRLLSIESQVGFCHRFGRDAAMDDLKAARVLQHCRLQTQRRVRRIRSATLLTVRLFSAKR